jgi:hypothetical protein
MKDEKNHLNKPAAAALAGLLSAIGIAGPISATINDTEAKIAALRAASPANVSGSILHHAVSLRDSRPASASLQDFLQFRSFVQFSKAKPVQGQAIQGQLL